jgi:hypothetical protein
MWWSAEDGREDIPVLLFLILNWLSASPAPVCRWEMEEPGVFTSVKL